MELIEGRTGTTRDGRRVQVRNGRVVYIDNPKTGANSSNTFNKSMDTAAAKDVWESRNNAAGALGRYSQASGLLQNLDKTPQGLIAKWQLQMGGLGMGNEQRARAEALNQMGSNAALADSAPLKPLSNDEGQWLKSLQAGVGQNKQTNEYYLRAQQWKDAKILGKTQAQDAWIRQYGSPNAMSPQGQSFSTWWATKENQVYPRPVLGQKGNYIPNRQGWGLGNPAPQQQNAQGRIRKYNPQTGMIE